MTFKDDTAGALCKENPAELMGRDNGPLGGLTFVAKDVFHIAGVGTSFGHPQWLATHDVPKATAQTVQLLLKAGADLVGKSHSDELCYSLTGENVHYGTPLNPAASDRIPGGSSSGSASAVAAGLCDFALGTDCGGSVRIPASYCGLYGIRPGLGVVSTDGVLDFAPSFDVVGWFAKSGNLMRRVGEVLLPAMDRSAPFQKLLIASDAFACASADVHEALKPSMDLVSRQFAERGDVTVSSERLGAWYETFRTIQGFEVWRSVGAWVESVKPILGAGVGERLAWASTVTPDMYRAAKESQAAIAQYMDGILPPGTALCLPTSPRVAPLKNLPVNVIEQQFRVQAMQILCIAGLSGLPQISLPLATLGGLPLGLSIVGWRGSERAILGLAESIGG